MDNHDRAVALYAELVPGHTFPPETIADAAERLATTDPETLKAELIAEAGARVRAAVSVILALRADAETAAA